MESFQFCFSALDLVLDKAVQANRLQAKRKNNSLIDFHTINLN